MFGRVGVQGENGQADECHVAVAGDLGKQDAYANLVRVFTFEEFQTESGQPLNEWMEQIKPEIEETNDESVDGDEDDGDVDDEDYYEDRGEKALSRLHDEFLPIVKDILRQNPNLYTHGMVEDERDLGRDFHLKKYARPNHRTATSHYASYLHNDAWIPWDKDGDNDTSTSSTVKVAMMNVWFVLNDQPPSNSLVFWETAADNTVQSHMLHAKPSDVEHSTVVYDKTMQWGRFYLFVAGQLNTSKRVLLHGAMDVPSSTETTVASEANTPPPSRHNDVVRRSVEMRYTVHLNV